MASMSDCQQMAAQIGARFYARKEAGKSKRYHVEHEGRRNDFRVLGDAYAFMSDIALGSLYGAEAHESVEDVPTFDHNDEYALRRALGVLTRWSEQAADADGVDDAMCAAVIDATSNLYEVLVRIEEQHPAPILHITSR